MCPESFFHSIKHCLSKQIARQPIQYQLYSIQYHIATVFNITVLESFHQTITLMPFDLSQWLLPKDHWSLMRAQQLMSPYLCADVSFFPWFCNPWCVFIKNAISRSPTTSFIENVLCFHVFPIFCNLFDPSPCRDKFILTHK